MTSPDAVRALARAAAQLAALAQPDVAAVLAALPRRPGETATLAELAEASGLELRVLGRAVARGRDAGVLAVDGDRVGAHLDGVRPTVAGLVALTPLGAALADRPELLEHAPSGVLPGGEGLDASPLLPVVAGLLPDGDLTEPQVTTRLAELAADPVGTRRALVDAGLLWRTPDGARYRRRDG